jgi:hypothetical protein
MITLSVITLSGFHCIYIYIEREKKDRYRAREIVRKIERERERRKKIEER